MKKTAGHNEIWYLFSICPKDLYVPYKLKWIYQLQTRIVSPTTKLNPPLGYNMAAISIYNNNTQ